MTAAELTIGQQLPRKGNPISRTWGSIQMKLMGWSFAGELPDIPKCIMIVAPHTSNWDFIVGIVARAALSLRVSWMGKKSLFKAPLGGIMKYLGGIPVYRDKNLGVVDQIAEAFRSSDKLILAITPEGTRSRREKWKTGFYFMAEKAGVPILPVSFDFKSKTIIFGTLLVPSGDFDADIKILNQFYSSANGKNPADFSLHKLD